MATCLNLAPVDLAPVKMQQGIILFLAVLCLSNRILTSSINDPYEDFEFFDCDDIEEAIAGDTLNNAKFVVSESPFQFPPALSYPGMIPPHSLISSFVKPPISASAPKEVVLNENVNAIGKFGLINHGNICYMSSFITASFYVRRFREAVYASKPAATSHVLLAEIYAKLQTATGPVSTNSSLMPAIKRDFSWEFGGFQCIMEFAGRVLDMMPNDVKGLYNLNMRTDYFLKDEARIYLKTDYNLIDGDEICFNTTYMLETHLIFPLRFESISEAIASRLSDHEAGDYIICREDLSGYAGIIKEFEEPKIYLKNYSEVTISNRPEMMIFGLRRKTLNGVDFTPMKLDFNLEFPGLDEGSEPVNYLLKSFSVYLNDPPHYISYVRDFSRNNSEGDWYCYNDSSVTAIRTASDYAKLERHANTSASLAFYVRSDTISDEVSGNEPEIPYRTLVLAKLMLALEEVDSNIEAKKRDEAAAAAKNKKYNSPPANRQYISSSSPTSGPTSIDAQLALLKSSFHSPQVLSTDDQKNIETKRNPKLPQSTNSAFLDLFPINEDYY